MIPSRFRSMRLQTAAIIIAGFAASHAVGYLIYSSDRRDAVLMTEALDIGERTAGVSRLLRDLPEDWRHEVVRVSDSRAFRVWISGRPALAATEPTEEETQVAALIRSQVPRIAGNDIRVRISEPVAIEDSPPPSERAPPPSTAAGRGARTVAMAIDHGDGEWLNLLGQINTPASAVSEFLWLSIISAVFGIGLVAFWLVHRVTVPLAQLSYAAERLGRDINAEPLPEDGPLEVARASAAFNRMQHRIVRLVDGRTELLAAISHDLRTPITQMRLRTELMRPSNDRTKQLAALDEMEATVATFLDYARAAGGNEERRRCDIGTLVETICSDLADTGAQVSWRAEQGLVTSCRRIAVKRGVTNLIDNALKYGQRAEVQACRKAEGIAVIVEDHGPGIPERELQDVFTPFSRGEASRNRETGGAGLGLSIAQAVAEHHGGHVRLQNREGSGLRAELVLPD